jgi:hypothetical protein
MEVAFENVYILVYPSKTCSKKHLLPLHHQITKNSKPLLIRARKTTLSNDALDSIKELFQ